MEISNCRICKGCNIVDITNLGNQVLTSRFPILGDFSTPKIDVILSICLDCYLVQLRKSANPSDMYENEYGYRSGLNNSMRNHLKSYYEEICNLVNLNPDDLILDIGSNDATMLGFFPDNLTRIGCDPTGIQFREHYTNNIQLIPTYFTLENFNKFFPSKRCKVISTVAMFYDLPDPVQFSRDIYSILEDDGIWTCEQSYVMTMLKQNSFDTICHEHLMYYSLYNIKEIAERSGFKLINVSLNKCNGGSFRVYLCKKSCNIYQCNHPLIEQMLLEEDNYGLKSIETFKLFMKSCDYEINNLKELIKSIIADKEEVWIYGASTKGNCLLQYANITPDLAKYAVERNPNKIGKMTSTGIEIIGEDTMRKNPPKYLLVLPWHFRDEIVSREKEYIQNGGNLIFPLPHLEIYNSSTKL
jgi:hypothetical protein